MESDKYEIDLCGQLCPFPVVKVINEVDGMSKGEKKCFLVDDPLAVKSVPEELSDYKDVVLTIEKYANKWLLCIERKGD